MAKIYAGTSVYVSVTAKDGRTKAPVDDVEEVTFRFSKTNATPAVKTLSEGEVFADDDVPGLYYTYFDTVEGENGKYKCVAVVESADGQVVVAKAEVTLEKA